MRRRVRCRSRCRRVHTHAARASHATREHRATAPQVRVCMALFAALLTLGMMVWLSWLKHGSVIMRQKKSGVESQRSDTPETAQTREALRKRR
mmetsp:Transcript_22600/g.59495  ORF Transcript_22600/g.59495 Transcript_22600/m.59495 type:complete len:93 (+) Transcript_22600:125-403(+)